MADAVTARASWIRSKADDIMARPQRYPYKIEFWTTPQQFEGLQLLTADQLTDTATQMRQALSFYLRHLGIAPARPAPVPNGQHKEQATHGV